ncbi:MAG: HAMP domain-containing histidine kinase [Bacteroidales bacterium]|nr:HAMP domain-containing histidine kinase [Bacteroidales bacterium]
MRFNSESFSTDYEDEVFKVNLFSDDPLFNPAFLFLYFPNEQKFLYKSVGTMAMLSIVLIVSIIIIFALTLMLAYRQKKLNQIKNDFINNMTHELKTPISTISLASQMLQDKTIKLEAQNMDSITGIIKDECKKLGHQVEKVLHLAAFEKGKIKLKPRLVHAHELVNNVVANFDMQVKSRQGNIKLLFKAEKDEIYLDQLHVESILSNLVDNALKYCDKQPQICISTQLVDGHLMISVKDNGIGISKSNLSRIFDQFYRIPTGNLHNVKGFGIGLSYVKHIVTEHGGRVEVTSEQGKSTEFRLYFPITKNI